MYVLKRLLSVLKITAKKAKGDGGDANLMIIVDCLIPADDSIVHVF